MIQNFIAFFIQPKLLVLHVKPMFVLSKRTLSSELGSGKIRINQKKIKIAFCRFFGLILH